MYDSKNTNWCTFHVSVLIRHETFWSSHAWRQRFYFPMLTGMIKWKLYNGIGIQSINHLLEILLIFCFCYVLKTDICVMVMCTGGYSQSETHYIMKAYNVARGSFKTIYCELLPTLRIIWHSGILSKLSINVAILMFEFVHFMPMYRWKQSGDWKNNMWFELFKVSLWLIHY
jgi:hypothetical protein